MKLLVLFVVSLAAGLDALWDNYGFGQNSWNYVPGNVRGPSKWGINEPRCLGDRQSPVNILTSHVKVNRSLEFELHNYDQTSSTTETKMYIKMKNRDKDIAFVAEYDDEKVEGFPDELFKVKYPTFMFNGSNYRFYEFSLHWGKESTRGSEHFLDSQRYAGELHIKHYNPKYKSVEKAMSQPDGLLNWAFFLKVNSENQGNPELKEFFRQVKYSSYAILTVEHNLFTMLPKSYDKFFTYSGSMTEPPCYEEVRWVINSQPILISEKQIKELRTLKDNTTNPASFIVDNYRPVQPLNSRTVEANFDAKEMFGAQYRSTITTRAPTTTTKASSGAAATAAPCLLTTITILTAMLFTTTS